MDEHIGHGQKDAGLERQLFLDVADEIHQLRYQVGHQEDDHQQQHGADESRIEQDFPRLGNQLVLPFELVCQPGQHVRQGAGGFAGGDQVDEHAVEYRRMLGQGLGKAFAAFDVEHQHGEDFAEQRRAGTVAQVGQSFKQRHARPQGLVQVKAEMDALLPRQGLAPQPVEEAGPLRTGVEGDQSQPGQALVQVQIVGGDHDTSDNAAIGACRPVGKLHGAAPRSGPSGRSRGPPLPAWSGPLPPWRRRRRPECGSHGPVRAASVPARWRGGRPVRPARPSCAGFP